MATDDTGDANKDTTMPDNVYGKGYKSGNAPTGGSKDVKDIAASKDGLTSNASGLSYNSVSVGGGGKVFAANVPDQETRDKLASDLQGRWDSGYGQLPSFGPVTGIFNAIGGISNKNIQNQLKDGGVPVYGKNGKISIGYDPNADIKDLQGVIGKGLFGETGAYSGNPNFNPKNYDKNLNRIPENDSGGDNNSTTSVMAAAPAPVTTKKQIEFAKANNVNPMEQKVSVRRPTAADGGDGDDGALVRRTKSLQSNRRGILGRPDTKKKTLLGS